MRVSFFVLTLFVSSLCAPDLHAVSSGDREAFANGVALLRKGKAKEAFAALRRAEKSFGDEVPVELLADLALAAQASGELGDAAAYAERAASRDERFVLLRDTVVGAVRLQEGREALSSGSPDALPKAAESAKRAVEAFSRALLEQPASKRARRNLERALKLQKEIEDKKQQQKKKDEQQKNQQQKDDEKDSKDQDKKDDEQKSQDQKQDEQKQDEQSDDSKRENDQQKGQQKQDEKKDSSDKRDESKSSQKQKQAPKPEESKDEQKPSESAADASKVDEKREMSAVELRRLKQKLEEILEKKRRIRLQRQPKPKPGKKDW